MPLPLWLLMKIKKIGISLIVFLSITVLSMLIFNSILPKTNIALKKSDFLKTSQQALNYVAIGDSLTQGVGDSTEQGGFVPLLSQNLVNTYDYQVTFKNYGISGNTSQQILKRMHEQSDIQEDLKKANLMTLTVGGNDIMAVFKKNITKLDTKQLSSASASYQKNLKEIIELARQDNSHLPIYILGVYNPFYLNFPQMTAVQDVIDQWNDTTEEITSQYEQVYFVPINDLLYKGVDGKEGVVQRSGDQVTVVNDALFEDDHFHPNNIGYQIMSNAVMEKINETIQTWSKN